MSDFEITMRDWKRMCDEYKKLYVYDCCMHCSLDGLKSCGGIWEMPKNTDWRLLEEKVDAWAEENPEPQYPTWAEWFLETNQVGRERHMYDWHSLLHSPIPADIAEKLGIEPKGGENDA